MARPDRGKFASGPAGQARYVAALKKHLANKKKAEEARKITSTKKNIEKQKTANKKTTAATTKTTKGTTSAKPTSTAAKGKSLATGKTKAVETPKTTTATKTRTRTRTQTNSKTTPKKTVTPKKPVAKKPAGKVPAKKPVAKKPAGKVPAKKPLISNKNKLQIKKAATTVAKKAGETKQAVTTKVDQVKKTFKKSKAPRPTTPQQKFVSKVYRGTKQYGKKLLKKGGKDLLKIGKGIIKNPTSAGKGILGSIVAGKAAEGINYAVSKGINKVTGGAVERGKKNLADRKKNPEKYERTLTGYRLKGTGSKKESSTSKNINKQKTSNNNKLKANNNLSAKNISKNKNKKNFYNTPDGKSPKADEIAKVKANIKKATGWNKENLKKQLNYLEKFGKMSSFTIDKNSKEYKEAKRINESIPTTSTTKSPKPGSARAKMRAKNEARFGKAHVDKLRAKNKDFQLMKKKKMTKAEFIRRYPNSQTAKRARGM